MGFNPSSFFRGGINLNSLKKVAINSNFSFCLVLWWIWRHRNIEVFNHLNNWTTTKVVLCIKQSIADLKNWGLWRNWTDCNFLNINWQFPSVDFTKVNCDASVLEDLDLAGFGCAIRNHHGDWIKGYLGSLSPWDIYRCEIFTL
ncbi:hypothetical protein PIB30_051936 [Stylosanthes scabra]|uniref:RNase H type-1 domain-containing protein n=1 Tax=Stylosanthes scabra TaxID=79078 RepID=A0ABU6UIW0_9FABA|nr:hypothetical protein [Stylosanthes scabra]